MSENKLILCYFILVIYLIIYCFYYGATKHQRLEGNLHQQPTYSKYKTTYKPIIEYVYYKCLRLVIAGWD